MAISTLRLRELLRLTLIAADLLVGLGLLAVIVLLWLEAVWASPHSPVNQEAAFLRGTIGTELMPLAVAEVLPDLAPNHFQLTRADESKCDNWIACFGFIPSKDGSSLPVGFTVANYRPRSGAPSPTPFVGFSCALCHTTTLRLADGRKTILLEGPGSSSLNLFAWVDAFQAALLERVAIGLGTPVDPARPEPYKITVGMIADKYHEKLGETLGLFDWILIRAWLRQIRSQFEAGLARFDEPYGYGRSRVAENVPTGPTRTQPFRTFIRQVLDRPGDDMHVYTKIATVFSEDRRTSAQFDGSIENDLYARSSMAAFAAGATVQNMRQPEIEQNIKAASDFTRTLRPPRFADVFPEEAGRLDPIRVARGREVYQQYCFVCHGAPDGKGGWVKGERMRTVIPYMEIATDPERVTFRHYGELPERLFHLFPDNHPFHFPRDQMLPSEADKDDLNKRGYVAQSLDGMFLRAPYLHNASVLTLAELINLKKRRDKFTRGDDVYDQNDVGFTPNNNESQENYFIFDTSQPGNSNKGHDYPWAFEDAQRHVEDLTVLLAYLKTL
jgi:hypothetical protein